MSQLKDQKLASLSWSHLIATPFQHPQQMLAMGPIYEHLGEFVAGWTGLLADVSESDEGE